MDWARIDNVPANSNNVSAFPIILPAIRFVLPAIKNVTANSNNLPALTIVLPAIRFILSAINNNLPEKNYGQFPNHLATKKDDPSQFANLDRRDMLNYFLSNSLYCS